MPYSYKGAVARSKSLDALWASVDLSNVDINEIFATYSKAYITLGHTALTSDVYLDLATARTQIGVYIGTKTIPQWLASLGSASLPTMNALPALNPKPVRYADAFRAGYHVNPVDRTRHTEAEIPFGEKNDLLIAKHDLDFRQWARYCLVSVNGYFHRTFGAVEGLYVVDGGRTGRLGNNNSVGIHSFREVGPMDLLPITPDMIYKTAPTQKFANAAHIKLPYSVDGKVVLLVLGGYLHVLDRAYALIGPQSLKVDFNNLALPERLYEAWDQIDLSSLGLEVSSHNPTQVSVDQLYSDEVIQAYLCLPQSFIIILDVPELYVRRHPIENTGLPGRYLCPADDYRNLPLISECGRVLEHRVFPEYGQMVLSTNIATLDNYTFATAPWLDQNSIDNTHYMGRSFRFAPAYQLEFGRFG